MPKSQQLPWDLDYKPGKNETTGYNLIKNALKNASWVDPKSGKKLSRKKLPKTIPDFAKLNQAEQSHIMSVIFDHLPLAYNKSLDQYGKQIQRYFKKIYKQQFYRLSPRMQMKLGKPREFDL